VKILVVYVSSLPEPFGVVALTVDGVLTTGGGAGAGGVGDRLGAVSEVEQCDLALGTVPEVDGLGYDGVVLGLKELFDEVMDEGSLAQVEVLAFGGLAVIAGGCTGGGAGG
jgi:hypothetical protein